MDVNGVTLPGISMSVRIDGYAIVTLNSKMESLLRDGPGEMKQVEEEWRWYGVLGNLNMNVEGSRLSCVHQTGPTTKSGFLHGPEAEVGWAYHPPRSLSDANASPTTSS